MSDEMRLPDLPAEPVEPAEPAEPFIAPLPVPGGTQWIEKKAPRPDLEIAQRKDERR